jgi:Tol biopolymer transport system component
MLSGKGPSRPRCCAGVSVLVKLHAPVGCEAACDDDRSSAARWDGRRIVYVDGSSGTFELYVMNADGTAKHHVARGDEPSWSPDGKKVAFLADPAIQRSPPAKENPEIYVVNADGTGLRRLTNNRI